MIRDLHYSARQIARNPGFSLTAVVSLALGIGATTAVFSVVYGALINPYPYPDANQIVRLAAKSKGADVNWIELNGPQVKDLMRSRAVRSVLAMDYYAWPLTGREYPENVLVVGLIATGFRDLGVPAFMGRGLLPSDALEGQEPAPVAVLSYYPKQFPKRFEVRVEGLNEWVTRAMSGTLYLLLGAVLLLLAIGCGNVSILLLARGSARRHELSVRSAMGANRLRLLQQLMTESLVLAISGAALGVLLSFGILAGMKTLLPRYAFAPEVIIRINAPVLFFSVGVALLTGVLFGLWPALRLSGTEIGAGMQLNIRRVAGSVAGRRTHQALVAGQIGLTLLLLSGAGAAMAGFVKMIRASLGYDPHNVTTVVIPLRSNSYTTWAARAIYFEQLGKTLAGVPGVRMTAVSTNATPPHNGWPARFELLGKPTQEYLTAPMNLVSPEYFAVLRIPLLQGRIWNDKENHDCAHVSVVNQAFARRYFPDGDAIGHALKLPGTEHRPPISLAAPQIADSWLTIVGIVADARDEGLRDPVKPAIYVPFTLTMGEFTQVLVRSDVPPASLAHALRAQVAKFNPNQQTFEPDNLESIIAEAPEWQQEHLSAWIFGVFAGLALALAAVGLYSVVSYTVAQRTGEFGIRMALGAQSADVMRAVFASTLISVVSGIAGGLLLSLLLSRIVEKWAGGNSRDPVTLVTGIILLSVVAGLACAIPARYATKIDPMSALRY